jgi:hypothetical protein
MNLYGAVKNSTRESYEGGFLRCFRELMRVSCDLLRIILTELNRSCLPDDTINVSVYRGEDAGDDECGVPGKYCAAFRLTILDVLARCAQGASSTWCRLNSLPARYRPDHTHRGYSVLLECSVPCRPWPARGSQRLLLVGGYPT